MWVRGMNVAHRCILIGSWYLKMLTTTLKPPSAEEKFNKLDIIIFKTCALRKTLLTEEKGKPQSKRKYLQITYLTDHIFVSRT